MHPVSCDLCPEQRILCRGKRGHRYKERHQYRIHSSEIDRLEHFLTVFKDGDKNGKNRM